MKSPLITAVGLLLLLGTPALANPSWEDVSFQTAVGAMDSNSVKNTPGARMHSGGYSLHRPMRPASGEPAVLATFVMASVTNPGVACFGCVPTAQNPNATAGIGTPLNYIDPASPNLDYTFFYQDFSFNGACAESIVVTAGKTVLFKATANFTLAAGSNSLIGTGGPPPSYTGPALLVAKIACPGTAPTSTKTTLYYQ